MDVVSAAIRLADEHGWHIVRNYGIRAPGVCACPRGAECPSPGKHPVGADWGSRSTNDSERIALDFTEGDNIGVVLGPKSGIIDIEYDTPMGREALSELLRGAEYLTPTYKSGRSTHRLFLWDEAFPAIAKIDVMEIEYRLGGDGRAAQSIIPPSTHHSGARYEWIEGMSPWECEPCAVPERLREAIMAHAASPPAPALGEPGKLNWRKKIQSVQGRPGRNRMLFEMACGLFNGAFNYESESDQMQVLRIIRGVNQTQCSPPVDDSECRHVIERAVMYRRQSATKHVCGEAGISTSVRGDVIEFQPESLELTVVTSEPVEYRLYSPAWKPLTDGGTGIVSLTSEQFRKAEKVADAVLEQTRVIDLERYPTEWEIVWDGKKASKNAPPVIGIRAKLLAAARDEGRIIDAPRAAKRSAVLAQYIWERLLRAQAPDDSDKPLASGAPKRMSDGNVWFRWEWLWQDIRRAHGTLEQEKRAMQRRIQTLFDGKWPTRRREVGGGKLAYCVWGQREMHLLEEYQSGEVDLVVEEVTNDA
jgi:hypothetical protein